MTERSSAAVDPPAPRKSPGVGILATLLVASVTVNIVLLVRAREREKLDAPAAADRSVDADGRLIARFEYRASEAFPMRTEAFDRKGRVDSISYDDNADGWHERVEVYTQNGLVMTQIDSDGDGVIGDIAIVKRGDVRLLELVDEDGDHWQETWRTLDAQGRPRLVMADRDGDGVNESIRCFDAAGVARELPPLQCPR